MKLTTILKENLEYKQRVKEIYSKGLELKNLLDEIYNDSVPSPLRGDPRLKTDDTFWLDLEKQYVLPFLNAIRDELRNGTHSK